MSLRSEIESHIASGKKFLVVGLGRSGVESARFLKRRGAPVCAVEQRSRDEFQSGKGGREILSALENLGVECSFGNSVPPLYDIALAVVSPGVPLSSEVPRIIRENGVPIISEMELGVELSEAESIIVTGTNGKSTTVSLVHRMCNTPSRPTILCGNIGTPVISVLEGANFFSEKGAGATTLVVEASSYQLEACSLIHPKIGVLLNLSENHLERHGNLEGYLAAKARLFRNQTKDDFAVLNRNDPLVWSLSERVRATVVPVGVNFNLDEWSHGALIEYDPAKGVDRILVRHKEETVVYSCGSSPLIGFHNRFNLAIALMTATLRGAEQPWLEECIPTFSTLEHRLERVDAGSEKFVLNDSKATTVAASVVALKAVREAFPTRSIKLMIGGLSKTGSWDPLVNLVRHEGDHIRLVCFGKDGKRLQGIFKEAGIPSMEFSTMKNAALYCYESIKADEIMLLSPGCASFDEFSDFEDRGRVFKEIISSIRGTSR